MAKDVDLSSKEWRDIVFQGKNQEYGAFEMRQKSDRRHNKAMLVIVIVLIGLFIAAFFVSSIQSLLPKPEDLTEQAMTEVDLSTVEEEAPEEEEQQRVEEPEPEATPEEILNTVKATELVITADAEVTEEIKSQDEMAETTTAVGTTDFDKGTDDLTVVREHKDEVIVEEKKPEPPKEDNTVFEVVEQKPQFPGGEAALLKYIAEHIRYPAMAQENNIQGRVVVKFVVTKTGSVGDVQVVRSKDKDLDKEAIRVVKSLPKFTPGKNNGHPVNVWYTLPINFKLQGV